MYKKYFFYLFFLIAASSVFCQESIDPYSVADSLEVDIDIFAEEGPGEITLKFDRKEFQKKSNEDKYLKAELIYHLGDSKQDKHHTVRIKARGKNRRETCSFPPFWINIRKADVTNKHLQNTTKIKLVTHCGGGKSFESYVLKEFLAYKIYNLISPYSFRVRLIRIKYIDTSRKDKVTESWSFLIEPEKMLAERLDMIPLNTDYVSIRDSDTLWTSTMSIFQLMVGNADYSVAGRHNVKLLKSKDFTKMSVIPVPYDFDYSGLVNAHYAVPGENLGLNSVKERYFLGPCRSPEYYQDVINGFAADKEEIMDLVSGFEYLSDSDKTNVADYLNEFFTEITDDRYIQRSILSTCR
jgi:hypothetical protein